VAEILTEKDQYRSFSSHSCSLSQSWSQSRLQSFS
jgi:hypothetical protein